MKILISSGSRGEWGYYKPIIEELVKRKIEYDIMTMNMASTYEYGNLYQVLKDQGYNVKHNILCSFHGDSHYAMSKMFSSLSSSVADILANYKYDWVLIAGDRVEQLAVATIASLQYIPCAHIQAGELSGNIDGVTRHVIGKLVKLHFAANKDAYDRLLKLGEENERVILSGAPQLDDIFKFDSNKVNLLPELIDLKNGDFILAVFHGVTEELDECYEGLKNMTKALSNEKKKIIYISPNNDAGGITINRIIESERRRGDLIFNNLDRNQYLYLLDNCEFIIGNSSSGLLEAPIFKTFCINIGNRQLNRVQGENVVDSTYDFKNILDSINYIRTSNSYKESVLKMISPYGESPASCIIVNELTDKNHKPDSFLQVRRITY